MTNRNNRTDWEDGSCHYCSPEYLKPGSLVKVDKEGHCLACGRLITGQADNIKPGYYREKLKRWDTYFHKVCVAIASKSPCLSRQIGAILVRDKSIVSTGYNGPARGYPHCFGECPRHTKGYKSGEGLNECPAAHAEANCIANAARIGASTIGTTLYMNCVLPCKDCATALVNAGIVEVIVNKLKPYHEMSVKIFIQAEVKTREFIL